MIALASDHGGFALKESIKTYLDKVGAEYKDFGTKNEESVDYAEFGYLAAKAVSDGECGRALLFCGTGIGIGITANKVKGIRCAICSDTFSAEYSRAHNDANALALGGRVLGPGLAEEIVKIWLATPFEGGRHARRVDKIMQVQDGNFRV
jgi:ribose 5-phosphate isomerase B